MRRIDSYPEIVYTILSRLYSYLRLDIEVIWGREELCADYYGIGKGYWKFITNSLLVLGYVEADGTISPRGLQYLLESETMQAIGKCRT